MLDAERERKHRERTRMYECIGKFLSPYGNFGETMELVLEDMRSILDESGEFINWEKLASVYSVLCSTDVFYTQCTHDTCNFS